MHVEVACPRVAQRESCEDKNEQRCDRIPAKVGEAQVCVAPPFQEKPEQSRYDHGDQERASVAAMKEWRDVANPWNELQRSAAMNQYREQDVSRARDIPQRVA